MTNLRQLRTANSRRPRAATTPVAPPAAALALRAIPADSRQPIADIRRSSGPRRGISLLEVLISMFVLLFGLMGVAAIFPVGNHYAGRGEQFDRGSALAESAFADLKARGMLRPEVWYYANRPLDDRSKTLPAPVILPPAAASLSPPLEPGQFNVSPLPAISNYGPGYAFVIDPMSTAWAWTANPQVIDGLDYFPYINLAKTDSLEEVNRSMPTGWNATGSKPGLLGDAWPVRRLSLQQSPATLLSSAVAETIFTLHDDVVNELPKENDRPGMQRWTTDLNGYPQNEPWNHRLLARQYTGGYSWIATVVPTSTESLAAMQPVDSRFGSDLYEVSVAVIHKREAIPPSVASERTISAQMLQGNELVLYDAEASAVEILDAAVEGIRPGNWIAVAGVHPTTGAFLMRWYRILSIDDETQENQQILDNNGTFSGNYAARRLMLDGPDWPLANLGGSGVRGATNLRAILLPGVISVSTQLLPMESAQ